MIRILPRSGMSTDIERSFLWHRRGLRRQWESGGGAVRRERGRGYDGN